MFYTYAHYTPQGRLFYIGKGQGNRAYKFYKRNKHWKNIVEKYGKPDVQILANWGTEKEAFSHEVLLIDCFRTLGHTLCNLTDGGEGPSGRTISEEHKKKISIKLKGRIGIKPTAEIIEKLKISHLGQVAWNKGLKGVIKHSAETKEKMRIARIGKTKNAKFKYIGVNLNNGSTIELIGNKKILEAGFDPGRVRSCANGTRYRKSHCGYSWSKKLLEKNKC
jgi:hypothetical protein